MVIPFIGVLIPIVVLIRNMKLIGSGCALFDSGSVEYAAGDVSYAGFMRAVPQELEEAAYIDGCSMFRSISVFFCRC